MSKTAKNTVEERTKIDISASFISAVRDGDLECVKKLVHSYGLSFCECASGGYVLLFVAIELGRIKVAEFLLQEGVEADCKTDNVTTPLHLAARQGFTGVVCLLLEKNTAVDARNCQNETPLHLAAKGGYAEVVEVLLNNSANMTAQTNEGATPLFLAAAARHKTVVQILLNHARANLKDCAEMKNSALLNQVLLCNPSICEAVNKLVVCIVTQDDDQSEIVDEFVDIGFTLSREFVNEPLLLAAITKNYLKLIGSILKNEANNDIATLYPQLLHAAVKIGCVEIAELFLKSGFNANACDEKGRTSLCYALKRNEDGKSVEIIQLLLKYKADITKAPYLLHVAVARRLIEVCKFIIEHGADVNSPAANGRTPLYLAVPDERNNIADEREGEGTEQIEKTENKIVELLLNSNADVSISFRRATAFHHAVLRGQIGTVSTFIKCRADLDVDARSEEGLTPLFLAVRRGDADIVEILCENNADVNAIHGRRSLLHFAVLTWKPDVVETLLKFDADVDFSCATVFNGRTMAEDANSRADRIHIKEIISNHAQKLEVAGLRSLDQGSYGYSFTFRRNCREEIERLKNQKLNPRLTLYDILINGTNPVYAKKRLLMLRMESFNFERFPIYRDVIQSNVRKCKCRLQLLQSGQKWLDILVKTSCRLNDKKLSPLPDEILEQIVSYLSNSDVKSLILCGEALKRQLGG